MVTPNCPNLLIKHIKMDTASSRTLAQRTHRHRRSFEDFNEHRPSPWANALRGGHAACAYGTIPNTRRQRRLIGWCRPNHIARLGERYRGWDGVLLAVSNGASPPSPTSGGGFPPFFDGSLNPVIAHVGAPPSEASREQTVGLRRAGVWSAPLDDPGGRWLDAAIPPWQRGMGGGGQPRQPPIPLRAQGPGPPETFFGPWRRAMNQI